MAEPKHLNPFSMTLPGEPDGMMDLRPRPVVVEPKDASGPTEDGFGHPAAALDPEISPQEAPSAPESAETTPEVPQDPDSGNDASPATAEPEHFDISADAQELNELL